MQLAHAQWPAQRQAAEPGKKARPHGEHAHVQQGQPREGRYGLVGPGEPGPGQRDGQGHDTHPADDFFCAQAGRDFGPGHITQGCGHHRAHEQGVGPGQAKALRHTIRHLCSTQQAVDRDQGAAQSGKHPKAQPCALVHEPGRCCGGGQGQQQFETGALPIGCGRFDSTAHGIDVGNLGERLDSQGAPQELLPMIDSFNTMLERLQQDCFAEDTGLEVEALNGEPGVKSARYAGEGRDFDANIDMLLKNLEEQKNRNARFRTVFTLIKQGIVYQFEGICTGTIIENRTGTGGFGYDPVFLPDGSTHTFAEMTMEEKNRFSHRKKGLERMIEFLKKS